MKGDVCGNRREQSRLELRGRGKEWLEEAGDRQEQVTWVIVYFKKSKQKEIQLFSFNGTLKTQNCRFMVKFPSVVQVSLHTNRCLVVLSTFFHIV